VIFMTTTLHAPTRSGTNARGFTLTELLVVVAIIVLLIGTLVVALGAAAKRAQSANTQSLMNTISSGLSQFQTDFGYLPPVLGARSPEAPGARGFARDVVRLDQVTAVNDIARQQLWFSHTTLADFLLGAGNRGEDGYGRVIGGNAGPGDRESPPFGIRSPGPDGAWGSIDAPQQTYAGNPNFWGYYRARNPGRLAVPPAVGDIGWNTERVEGKVYGPYIDLKDERLIGGLTGFDANGRPQIVTAEQDGNNFDNRPKVILDYWGEPIAYYRAPYGGNDVRSTLAKPDGTLFNLGDVYALRAWTIDPNDQSDGAADAGNDPSSGAALKSASFALRSNGPDRRFDATRRRDIGEFNKDNIVQSGR
jgi:prepilin-type N-terminal cleavage/methylation domain-containing protein